MIIPLTKTLTISDAIHFEFLIESVNEGWNSSIPFYSPDKFDVIILKNKVKSSWEVSVYLAIMMELGKSFQPYLGILIETATHSRMDRSWFTDGCSK